MGKYIILALLALFIVVTVSLISSSLPGPLPSPAPVPTPISAVTGQPAGVFCGGFAGVACPSGYTCRLDGNYPDAGGICIKNGSPVPVAPVVTPTSIPQPVSSGCKTGGCSNELCLDAGAPDQMSICVYKDEYACLKYASCEKNSAGQCAWKYTDRYYSCVGYE